MAIVSVASVVMIHDSLACFPLLTGTTVASDCDVSEGTIVAELAGIDAGNYSGE